MFATSLAFLDRFRAGRYLSLDLSKNSLSTGEPKKVVVSDSRRTALRRCIFHIPPVLGSIAILTLNLHGIYLGEEVNWLFKSETLSLMGFQILAKIHEIFIVTSLGLIVLHAVRNELLFGHGLPLGLVGSGLSFSNFSFFFTREFGGGLRNLVQPGHRLRKASFIGLLCLAGAIATLAGPSSATLMVPQTQSWSAGATEFFLNGSLERFWPSDLSKDMAELQQYCDNETSTASAFCPAGGFISLQEHWGRMNYTNFYDYDVPPYAKMLSGSRFYWPIHSPTSPIPPLYQLGDPRTDQDMHSYTFLVQPHAAAATLMQRIATDWWTVLVSTMGLTDSRVDDRNIGADVLAAITSVRCTEPQNISESGKTVRFPAIDGRFTYIQGFDFVVDGLDTNAVNHLRFQWVHLPETFGAVSIGGVFESPWSSDNKSRIVIGCSAQSGWLPATILTDKYSFWSGWYPWGMDWGGRTPAWTSTPANAEESATNGRIAISSEWLDLLTPTTSDIVTGAEVWQPSTIESVLDNAKLAADLSPLNGATLTEEWVKNDPSEVSRTTLLEAIVCSVLVDGLSRTGSYRAFNTTGPSSEWPLALYDPLPDFANRLLAGRTALSTPSLPSAEVTTIHIKMQIDGFALKATLATFLSMAVLLIHVTMALVHTGWVLVRKKTSNSWDSISELLALAQNSQPASVALGNTAAGINLGKTYAQIAKIRVRNQYGYSNNDHVALVFDESGSELETTAASSGRREQEDNEHHAVGIADNTMNNEEDSSGNRKNPGSSEISKQHILPLSRTWPRPRGDILPLSQTLPGYRDISGRSRSTSTESLIPSKNVVKEMMDDRVVLNRAYG
ncbi:uncharacterized protein Z518_08386 [Rhinocladiella mackenziei CBS 650.93]|uniref:Rhinocladiella mackenziei CBS 650.93 unplaced genomic scaffold supercont1.6, whole genome shotgun sequence n=1 Tax=Rhinocladiella mackenziei CBS 650.93 TaxID=1442369 RepID=A0A0D2J0N7_9EURO|nr:uncharacterized protein Z518_08386 [Rhinocladiella mackenziei CBS 650.93]KIX02445.1 hypothetical protein Z518_08386 [Rhinocladiella mackenziei CBS 650.93]